MLSHLTFVLFLRRCSSVWGSAHADNECFSMLFPWGRVLLLEDFNTNGCIAGDCMQGSSHEVVDELDLAFAVPAAWGLLDIRSFGAILET